MVKPMPVVREMASSECLCGLILSFCPPTVCVCVCVSVHSDLDVVRYDPWKNILIYQVGGAIHFHVKWESSLIIFFTLAGVFNNKYQHK